MGGNEWETQREEGKWTGQGLNPVKMSTIPKFVIMKYSTMCEEHKPI